MTPIEDVSVAAQLSAWIHQALDAHHAITAQLPRLEQLAGESADANQDEPECRALRETSAELSASISSLFDRESRMIFPMLRRLADQTSISPCRAGSVSAWVRQMIRMQTQIQEALNHLRELATAHLSPVGPCESCHNLLSQANLIANAFEKQAEFERKSLFDWAIIFEEELICRST